MTEEQVEMLQAMETRLTISQRGHYATCSFFLTIHYWVGIPLIIITTVVTALSSSETSSTLDVFIQFPWIATVLGVFSTIFASLQVFIKPSEKAEQHRQCAIRYGCLKREIETFLAYPKEEIEVEEFFEHVRESWQVTAEMAPLTPKRLYLKAEKETLEEARAEEQQKLALAQPCEK